jgi:hypothetical protein
LEFVFYHNIPFLSLQASFRKCEFETFSTVCNRVCNIVDGSAAALVSGLIVGKFAADYGVANGLGIAVIISMAGVVLIPAYIVKKLLVDYW